MPISAGSFRSSAAFMASDFGDAVDEPDTERHDADAHAVRIVSLGGVSSVARRMLSLMPRGGIGLSDSTMDTVEGRELGRWR
jgi:hypothetical protein